MFGKRKDGDLVKGLSPVIRMLPFIMPIRSKTILGIYYTHIMDEALEFIRRKSEEGEHYTTFDIVMAAYVRTLLVRPHMNRFIKGKRYYQRNYYSCSLIAKKKLEEDGNERMVSIFFDKNDSLKEVSEKLRDTVKKELEKDSKEDEKTMKFLLCLPKWMISFIFWFMDKLDDMGLMPKSLMDIDGLHNTFVLANLGSIGVTTPTAHHLYDRGTTSMVVTMARMRKAQIVNKRGVPHIHDVIDFHYSLDERVAEALYYSKTIKLIDWFIRHPEALERRGDDPEAKVMPGMKIPK